MPYSRILISSEELEQIVSSLAKAVDAEYLNLDNCAALVVLDGARNFADDLLRETHHSFEMVTIKASSYSGTRSTGSVVIDNKAALEAIIKGKHVLLIDDIYDTGLTLSRILEWLDRCGAQSVKTCVLLEKEIDHAKQIKIDFLGTRIDDVFAIGYGLDHEQRYRDLPFIAELSPDLLQQHDVLEDDQGL
jgi:hypoxanthine phosphoribosyltransferase